MNFLQILAYTIYFIISELQNNILLPFSVAQNKIRPEFAHSSFLCKVFFLLRLPSIECECECELVPVTRRQFGSERSFVHEAWCATRDGVIRGGAYDRSNFAS